MIDATKSLLGTRATSLNAHVGKLQLTTFVYLLTGAFVFLICLLPFIRFFSTFNRRFSYHPIANNEQDHTPSFRQSQGQTLLHLESLARAAVDKHPLQPTPHISPPVHNIPLPTGNAPIGQADSTAEVTIDDLYDLQELLVEKKGVDITIHNLKRVIAGVEGASSAPVMGRLLDTTRRQGQLVTNIAQLVERLKDHRASWTDEEWGLISLILEAHGKRL